MDEVVGKVLIGLDELGFVENIIVVFIFDNGGVVVGDVFFIFNLFFCGGKGYQYEGGIWEFYLIKVFWMKVELIEIIIFVIGIDFYLILLELVGFLILFY